METIGKSTHVSALVITFTGRQNVVSAKAIMVSSIDQLRLVDTVLRSLTSPGYTRDAMIRDSRDKTNDIQYRYGHR